MKMKALLADYKDIFGSKINVIMFKPLSLSIHSINHAFLPPSRPFFFPPSFLPLFIYAVITALFFLVLLFVRLDVVNHNPIHCFK